MFADINLSEERLLTAFGVPQNPGVGGWPTIRYYNAYTGLGGAPYARKTPHPVADELGHLGYLRSYIEEVRCLARLGCEYCNC